MQLHHWQLFIQFFQIERTVSTTTMTGTITTNARTPSTLIRVRVTFTLYFQYSEI